MAAMPGPVGGTLLAEPAPPDGAAAPRAARRARATELVRAGRVDEAAELWYAELATGEDGLAWADDVIANAMTERDLGYAGRCAELFTRLRWVPGGGHAPLVDDVPLSAAKLRHDADQLDWLARHGVPAGDPALAGRYRDVADRVEAGCGDGRVPVDDATRAELGDTYGRIVHVRRSPRLPRALSDAWRPAEVEESYLSRSPGIVVIDDFLSPEALAELRLFCLESTIWHANRYKHGRLGAFFRDGFGSPLLLQLAEDLRAALPNVIGDRYPLRQMWGFKNQPTVPADSSLHADFAAVNVNFWITPTESNLDEETGGFDVYEVDAPPDWDFATYNGRADLIRELLRQNHARRVRIPYRANRAIIFDSDLFHETAGVNFAPGYEDRRVNITMLYGHREEDEHFLAPRRRVAQQSWRSASLRRGRP